MFEIYLSNAALAAWSSCQIALSFLDFRSIKYRVIIELYPDYPVVWYIDLVRLPFKDQKCPVNSSDGASFHHLHVPWSSSVDIVHPAPLQIKPPLDLIEQK